MSGIVVGVCAKEIGGSQANERCCKSIIRRREETSQQTETSVGTP
jgi:hypothetical protein